MMDQTLQPMTVVTRRPNTFYLKPNSPLREDMIEILKRKQRGEIKLHSHAEVWGE